MEYTEILKSYGQPITYFGIAYTFTEEDNERLNSFDSLLKERLEETIYRAPDGSRHITIMNLTRVANGTDEKLINLFEGSIERYRKTLSYITSMVNTFKIQLTTPQASPQAIILRGNDSGRISTIRENLLEIPQYGGRVIDPGYVHSTQARYKKSVPLSKVREQLVDIHINIPITVDKIGLVRADVGFSQPHIVLEEFKLQP